MKKVGRVLSVMTVITAVVTAALAIAADKRGIPPPPTGIDTIPRWDKLPGLRARPFNALPQGLPDLIGIATTGTDPCDVTFQVRNIGSGPVPEDAWSTAQVRVEFWDIRAGGTLVEDHTVDLRVLPGAETLRRNRNGETVPMKLSTPRGTVREVRLLVDVTDVVVEVDNRNNIATAITACL